MLHQEVDMLQVDILDGRNLAQSFKAGQALKQGISVLAYDGTQWSGTQILSFDDSEAVTTAKGVFDTRASLTSTYPNPKVGWYAYVGTAMPLKLFQCATSGVWSDSGMTTDSVNGIMLKTVTREQFEVMEEFVPNVLYVVVE